jgi:hypothetical protein
MSAPQPPIDTILDAWQLCASCRDLPIPRPDLVGTRKNESPFLGRLFSPADGGDLCRVVQQVVSHFHPWWTASQEQRPGYNARRQAISIRGLFEQERPCVLTIRADPAPKYIEVRVGQGGGDSLDSADLPSDYEQQSVNRGELALSLLGRLGSQGL